MEIKDQSIETDGDINELVVTFVATSDEVDKYTRQFFNEIAQREIDGFRKGKAPKQVLEEQVGGHEKAMGGVAETLINELGFAALDDADIIFLDEPEFNVDKTLEEGKPFSFSVSGKVAPKMQLSSYDPVCIKMPPDEATEAEIDERIEMLRDYYHTFEDVSDPEQPAQMGDYVLLTMTISNHDKPIQGLRNATRMIGLGEGSMPHGFDEHIEGAKKGEKLEFDFEAKTDSEFTSLGDGELHAQVEINAIRKLVLPELDDDFFGKVGVSNLREMRETLRMTIDEQKRTELPHLMEERVIEALSERLEGEVPEYFVDFMKQDVTREFMQSLDKQGVSLSDWLINNRQQTEQLKQDIASEALRRAKSDLAIEALFAHMEWEITEVDIDKELGGAQDAEQIKSDWKKANRMADLRKICRQSKVTRWLVRTAEVEVVERVD